MRLAEAGVLLAICVAGSVSAQAAEQRQFDIPAGPLSETIGIFGSQANVSAGVSDASAMQVRTRAVRGTMPAKRAIERMLRGTGLDVEVIDAATFRIVAARRTPGPPPPGRDTTADAPIVVTASKQRTELADFPGTVSIAEIGGDAVVSRYNEGTGAVIHAVPALASTHLGRGRNKLIIRGVADSSFTGPSQAIVGQYLGDVRLNYNAPDPDLVLYDVSRVEVLEGPQGTLYGAGSLGGIVRLLPNRAEFNETSASAAAGYSLTRSGADGHDLAAMVNLPLGEGVALRAVAYQSELGGYIDDSLRALKDINRTRTSGGRAELRIDAGDGWDVELGGVLQSINAADGQYAIRGGPRLSRRSAIAQPFDNDYGLGHLTVRKSWDGFDLVSATGYVHHHVRAVYDASRTSPGNVIAFAQDNRSSFLSNETRLSRDSGDGISWLVGVSLIFDSEKLLQSIGPPRDLQRINGVRNNLFEGALYGQARIPLGSRVELTAGGRAAYTRQSGNIAEAPADDPTRPKRRSLEILPSIALAWQPSPPLTVFARYEEGFRPGGLSVRQSDTGLVSQQFEGDNIQTFETGLRFGSAPRDRFSASATVFYTHWENIQADLIDAKGFPFTANIGNGAITGFEANADLRVAEPLTVGLGIFINDSDLRSVTPSLLIADTDSLANVAPVGAFGAVHYRREVAPNVTLTADASARYFGLSRLGVEAPLSIRQDDYVETSLTMRLGSERLGLSLDVSNFFNEASNRFSFGNPFEVADGTQVTPQRPRTLRIGLDAKF